MNKIPNNFTMVFEDVIQKTTLITALVHGAIFRIILMRGICDLSNEQIGKFCNLSSRTIITHIGILKKAGYIIDTTPESKNRPHILILNTDKFNPYKILEVNNSGHYINYYDYIKSDKWKRISRAAKERAGYKCQLCNSKGTLNTHHRTYENLGNERPEDLIVLCESCHTIFHDNGRIAKPNKE